MEVGMQMKIEGRSGKVVQLAIHAQDPKGAAAFYRAAFGWESASFLGSPESRSTEVFVIENVAARDMDLRARIEPAPATGPRASGFECTVAVESIEALAAVVVENGGMIIDLMPFVSAVGGRLRFADPEGNVVTAMQFAQDGDTKEGD